MLNTQLGPDDQNIQIEAVAVFLKIFEADMNILFIICKVKNDSLPSKSKEELSHNPHIKIKGGK